MQNLFVRIGIGI